MRHCAPFANFSEKASRPLPGVPPTAGLGSQSARETPRNDRPGRVQGGVPIDARARERANPAPDPRLRPRPRRAQRAIHAGSVAPRFSVPSAARRQIEGGGSPHGGPGSQMPRRGTRTEPNSAAVRLHTPRRASVLMGSWARGARDHATFGRRGNSSETPPKGESKLAAGSAPDSMGLTPPATQPYATLRACARGLFGRCQGTRRRTNMSKAVGAIAMAFANTSFASSMRPLWPSAAASQRYWFE